MADLSRYIIHYELALGEKVVDKLNNLPAIAEPQEEVGPYVAEMQAPWHIEAEPVVDRSLRSQPDLLVTNGDEAILVEFKEGPPRQSAHFSSLVQVHEYSESLQQQGRIRKINAAFITNQEIDPGVEQVAQSLDVDMFRTTVRRLEDLNTQPQELETIATRIVENYLERRDMSSKVDTQNFASGSYARGQELIEIEWNPEDGR